MMLKAAGDDMNKLIERVEALTAKVEAATDRPTIERVLAETLRAGLADQINKAGETALASAVAKMATSMKFQAALWATALILTAMLGVTLGLLIR